MVEASEGDKSKTETVKSTKVTPIILVRMFRMVSSGFSVHFPADIDFSNHFSRLEFLKKTFADIVISICCIRNAAHYAVSYDTTRQFS